MDVILESVRFALEFITEDDAWGSSFSGKLEDIAPLPKRLGLEAGNKNEVSDTGDSTLGVSASVNWDKKEFICEESSAYINEIDHPHRKIIIGNSEQLSATSIVGKL